MKTVIRTDRASLGRPKMTSQGFLKASGHFARAGIYEYRNDDGTIRYELRPREEVHDPEALASYDAAPVTIGHPADGEVTADNVRKYEVGHVAGEGRADGDAVAGEVVVKHNDAIKLVKGGLQELSPGYRITLDETSGSDRRYGYPGNEAGRWDAVQRKIRVNHLAIVPRARGGSSIRLRMDAADQVEDFRHDASLSAKERKALTASDFAVAGTEDMPINDASHVRAAMSRFDQYAWKDAAQKRTAYGRIIRRAKSLGVDASGFVDKWSGRLDGTLRLTTVVDGHQHSVDLDPCYGSRMSGCTSWAISTNEQGEHGHSHDWVRNADGTITLTLNEGHTHAVILDDIGMPSVAPPPRYDGVFDRSPPQTQDGHMDKDEQIRSLREQLAAAEAKIGPLTERAERGASRADMAEATVHTLRGEITELRSQIASAATVIETEAIRREKQRADAAEARLSQHESSFSDRVTARVALERKAAVVLGDRSLAGVPEREIWGTVVKRLDASAEIGSNVSDSYLEGRFDSLLESHHRNARAHRLISDVVAQHQQQRADAEEQTLEQRRAAYRNRGNEPLPNSREAHVARGKA